MNTKRLFFGVLAIAFLAMTAVSTTVISGDSLEDAPSVEKKKVVAL
ncbi:hypothetical protein [Flagellimonas sp.]